MQNPNQTNRKPPLMLWCSSHFSLAAEEIPMLMEAGFRVLPLLTDFWKLQYNSDLDSKICSDWKQTIDLPSEVINKLQALRMFENMGQNKLNPEEIKLLDEHVDVVYATVLPNVAIKLAQVFKGTVIFRPFGQSNINTYSRMATNLDANLNSLAQRHNYMWVPILTTLQELEDPRICVNANYMGAFVSPSRLGSLRWSAETSQPYVVETIPRIGAQSYYMDIYKQYSLDYGDLPLRILGGNSAGGGELADPAILGFLDDEAYFRTIAQARLSIYHGKSRYHVHYHPIEFMTLGVPVLFHEDSAFVAEGQHYGLSDAYLREAGMYSNAQQAKSMALAAFADPKLAEKWSQMQRVFLDQVFNREKVLDQARWIRRRVEQYRDWVIANAATAANASTAQSPIKTGIDLPTPPSGPSKPHRTLPHRVYRELKRAIRKIRRPV